MAKLLRFRVLYLNNLAIFFTDILCLLWLFLWLLFVGGFEKKKKRKKLLCFCGETFVFKKKKKKRKKERKKKRELRYGPFSGGIDF